MKGSCQAAFCQAAFEEAMPEGWAEIVVRRVTRRGALGKPMRIVLCPDHSIGTIPRQTQLEMVLPEERPRRVPGF